MELGRAGQEHELRALCRAPGGPDGWAECCFVSLVVVERKEEENRKESSSRAGGAEVSLREEAGLGAGIQNPGPGACCTVGMGLARVRGSRRATWRR